MHRVYLNATPGQRRIHVEITEDELPGLIAALAAHTPYPPPPVDQLLRVLTASAATLNPHHPAEVPAHHPEHAAASQHIYLSTGCLHGHHDYCQGMTGLAGNKRPAECKFADTYGCSPCVCTCHTETTEATA